MKKYRFIVRTKTHSFSFILEANNEKEAIQKGYDLHGDLVTTATVVEL
ncbi:hypothetical protein [Chryseobacterium gleum]|nr:hypothetical protein [Chryseobacterium gleum]QQY32077.1 hypothetical protein I6I60_25150 [Chryseobacterium gleum]